MHTLPETTQQSITIDGYTLNYATAGDPTNPPLLLVHGWLSWYGVWRHELSALSARYHCIAVDLLGHGYSDKPHDSDYSIPAQAKRLVQLMDALGFQQFAYIGHSMGALLGFYIAIHHPGHITRLVNVAGVVNGRLSNGVYILFAPIMRAGAVFPAVWNITRFMVRYRWYRRMFDSVIYYKKDALGADDPDRQMSLQRGVEIPMWRDLQAIAACDLSGRLSEITIPVLTIFGEQDRTVPAENVRLVMERISTHTLVMLDECGHVPMYEQTDAHLAAVRDFLGVKQRLRG